MSRPHVDVEIEWSRIIDALRKWDGVTVRDRLKEVERVNIVDWNILYWRVNAWIRSFLCRFPMTEQEEKMGLERGDLGSLRISSFLFHAHNSGYGGAVGWKTDEIPYLMSRLKELERLHKEDPKRKISI